MLEYAWVLQLPWFGFNDFFQRSVNSKRVHFKLGIGEIVSPDSVHPRKLIEEKFVGDWHTVNEETVVQDISIRKKCSIACCSIDKILYHV